MNPKLFGAIVIVGAALGGCRTGILPTPGPALMPDAAIAGDAADAGPPVDLADTDLPICCVDFVPAGADLAGCTPFMCILLA